MPRYLSRHWCTQRYFLLYFLYTRQKYGHRQCAGLMSGYRSVMHLYEPIVMGTAHLVRRDALAKAFAQLRHQAQALPEGAFKKGFLLALEESDPRHYW